jgi:hypothetical protein
MNKSSQVKFIKEVEASDRDIRAQKPFRVEQQEQRRFVRLEISSPMSLRHIRDLAGNFWPEGNRHVIDGTVLNISGGGVLAELNEQVHEGDVVSMRFTLQGVETLDNVLGLVKRAEHDDGAFVVGIEFITRERMADVFTQGEMDILSERMTDFEDQVRTVLGRYMQRDRVSSVPMDEYEGL